MHRLASFTSEQSCPTLWLTASLATQSNINIILCSHSFRLAVFESICIDSRRKPVHVNILKVTEYELSPVRGTFYMIRHLIKSLLLCLSIDKD